MCTHERDGLLEITERMGARGLQASVCERLLAESPIVFEPIAKRTAADHGKPFAPELILLGTVLGRLEQDDTLRAALPDPVELAPPIVNVLDHPRHHVVFGVIAVPDAYFVPLGLQPQIHVSEIAAVTDTKKTHATFEPPISAASTGRSAR
jgi:hypothetical protein